MNKKNDEIEEILSFKENADYKKISVDEVVILKDYITNLQEIVYNLTTMTVCGDMKQIKNTAQYKLELAQQRIDKAIEYIERALKDDHSEFMYMGEPDIILDILRGEDNVKD